MESMSAQEVNESYDLAKEVFDKIKHDVIKTNKSKTKFYNVPGIKMALIVIKYDCDTETSRCSGCEHCTQQKQDFAKAYDEIASDYKRSVIDSFQSLEKEALKRNDPIEENS